MKLRAKFLLAFAVILGFMVIMAATVGLNGMIIQAKIFALVDREVPAIHALAQLIILGGRMREEAVSVMALGLASGQVSPGGEAEEGSLEEEIEEFEISWKRFKRWIARYKILLEDQGSQELAVMIERAGEKIHLVGRDLINFSLKGELGGEGVRLRKEWLEEAEASFEQVAHEAMDKAQQRFRESKELIRLGVRRATTIGITAAIGSFLAALLLSLLLARMIARPIERMKEAAQRVGRGEFEVRLEVPTTNELGVLADSFNRMTRELKQTLIRLQESEERYALATQGANDGLWDWDLKGNNIYFSRRWKSIIGYDNGEIDARPDEWFTRIHPDDAQRVQADIDHHVGGATGHLETEHRIMHRDGTYRWVLCRGLAVRDPKGVAYRMAGSQSDITGRKHAEESIKASLVEKDMLLKEIHHRVKNNLQVISSLFYLQGKRVKDREALEIFRNCRDRIKTMAMIHEKLYKTKDLVEIDFVEFIREMISNLRSSYGVEQKVINIALDVDPLILGVDKAVPCGLVINELVSNALKHAFPGGRKGEIKLSFRRLEDGMLSLVVADDGVGVSEGVDLKNPQSLGLQLVDNLVHQLDGDLTVERQNGAAFRITFPES